MVKNIQIIVNEVITGVLLHKNMGDSEIRALLKEWADSIVDECANVVVATRPDTSTQDITEVKEQIK